MCRRCFASGRVPAEAAGPFSLDACKLRRGDFPVWEGGPAFCMRCGIFHAMFLNLY